MGQQQTKEYALTGMQFNIYNQNRIKFCDLHKIIDDLLIQHPNNAFALAILNMIPYAVNVKTMLSGRFCSKELYNIGVGYFVFPSNSLLVKDYLDMDYESDYTFIFDARQMDIIRLATK